VTGARDIEAPLQETWEALVAVVPSGVLMVDLSGKIVLANSEAERIFGAVKGGLVGRPVETLMSPELHAEHTHHRRHFATAPRVRPMGTGSLAGTTVDGHALRLEIALSPLPSGAPGHTMALVRDVSSREEQDARSRLNSAAFSAAANGIMITDASGKIVSVNDAFTRLTGYAASEVIGKEPGFLKSGEMASDYYQRLWTTILAGSVFSGEVINRRKDGTLYVEEQTITPVPDAHGKPAYFVAIKQDVTLRHEDQKALRAAKLAAEAATEAKSRFLASMSHEIRTPMNAVIGVAELLIDSPLDARQQELVETLRSSGEALLTLLDEILDFSKVEAGRLDLVHEPFDPIATLEGCLALLAARADARGIELGAWVAPDVPTPLIGDAQRFSQIVMNLIGNAVKFTEEGCVAVSIEPDRGARPSDEMFDGLVTIRDTGIGIPAEHLPLLFQRFAQGDSSSSRRFKGTGLGLAISRRLAELMDGTIDAESTGVPGEGSTFRFRFRVRRDPRSATGYDLASLRGRQVVVVGSGQRRACTLPDQLRAWGLDVQIVPDVESVERYLASCSPEVALVMSPPGKAAPTEVAAKVQAAWRRTRRVGARLPMILFCTTAQRAYLDPTKRLPSSVIAVMTRPARSAALLQTLRKSLGEKVVEDRRRVTKAPPRQGPAPLRILVIEDDAVNQMLIREMLAGLGQQARLVDDASGALAACAESEFDILFMDMQLPGMDGIEATRVLRSRERPEKRARIIALTANVFPEDRKRCLDAGMDDFLAKPLRRAALLDALTRATQAPARRSADETALARSIPPSAPLLDASALHELVDSLAQSSDALARLLDTLTMNAEKLVDAIEAANNAGKIDELRRHAHSLKSNANMFGLVALAEVCGSIEESARNNALAEARRRVQEVRPLFNQSRTALFDHMRPTR
jgi:PAS domain S-box-containing protein